VHLTGDTNIGFAKAGDLKKSDPSSFIEKRDTNGSDMHETGDGLQRVATAGAFHASIS
jgi:hypothetical protein